MKFFTIASGIVFAIAGAAAQVSSSTQDYNVTSPVPNGPYVAGQVLPCTVDVIDTTASIQLSISLVSIANSSVSFLVASSVDTTQTNPKQNGNVTYYEHSVNYNIPTNITVGAYNVEFSDATSGTKLDIPINVLPVAASTIITSAAAATGSAAPSASSQAVVFKNEVADMAVPGITTRAIISLASVAVFAFML